jgi:hypothetical protein
MGGLLRDANASADQVPEAALTGDVDFKPGEIDPGELARLRASAGLIVTRDTDGDIKARAFPTHEELAAGWSAILVELSPSAEGPPNHLARVGRQSSLTGCAARPFSQQLA